MHILPAILAALTLAAPGSVGSDRPAADPKTNDHLPYEDAIAWDVKNFEASPKYFNFI